MGMPTTEIDPSVVQYIEDADKEGAEFLVKRSDREETGGPFRLEGHAASPEEHANLISQCTFSWMTGLVKAGFRSPLAFEDLPQLASKRDPEYHANEFERRWKEEKLRSDNPSAWGIIFRMYWAPLFITAVCSLWADIAIIGNYWLLQMLIVWVQEGIGSIWEGLTYSVLIFAMSVVTEAFAHQQYLALNTICGMNTANAMATAVYRKTLRLPSNKTDKGEVVTLISVDSKEALKEFFDDIHIAWNGVIQVVIIFGLLAYTLGWAVLAGGAITALLVPLNLGLSVFWEKLQNEVMDKQQKRVNCIAETLDGIEVIKYFHWEEFVKRRIEDIRRLELNGIRSYALCISFIMTVILANYTVTSMASFALYYLLGNDITPDIVFPSMYLFFISVWPLLHLAHQLAKTARARSSMERIRQFLLLPELLLKDSSWDGNVDVEKSFESDLNIGISLSGCSYRHHGQDGEEDCLHEIEFKAGPGELVAIVGEVGSGKSTLLRSILGETIATNDGVASLNGGIAYCAQTPWIRNMTVRDNILAGKRYNEVHYADTLTSCALLPDLAILPAGERTEIGERGTNLSGGQKARIALARAVYSCSDIVLLDDPLSAVDAHVGNQLFHDCICGVLKNTTRVLVTHQLQFLPFVDRIYIMKAGKIEQSGSYEELIEQGVTFATLAQAAPASEALESPDLRSSTQRKIDAADVLAQANNGNGKLVEAEEHQTGSVSFDTWASYLLSMGGIQFVVGFAVVSVTLVSLQVATSIVLTLWSTASGADLQVFFVIYVILSLSYAMLTGCRNVTWFLGAYGAAKKLHYRMLKSVLRSPIQFFNSTPKGRILNRFSKDQTVVDQYLPDAVSDVIICALDLVSKAVVLSIAAPLLVILFVPIGAAYYFLQRVYRPTKRELARLDSINSSPIYEHCSESVDGVETIRASKSSGMMTVENMFRMRKSMMAMYSLAIVERWLGTRTSLTGSIISLSICCSSVLMVALGYRSPLTYLAISYSLDICGVLSWLVMVFAQAEAFMSHVERMLYYSSLPSEAEVVVKETEPPSSWPHAGAISFQDLSVRYKAGHELVLKRLSFDVEAGQRVGIVGRTGAGKSTLLMSLFRLLEPSDGRIVIDGVDIHTLGLRSLRNKISVIPQDPVLLSGSLRFNLDPSNTADDAALWRALEHAHIADFIRTIPDTLDSHVDGSQSFSNGQRQLLCLARALLQQTRILVMDEATASVDPETDLLIQETIRTEFLGRTILTIAHRLSTIIDYDCILVLDQGELVESGSPAELLRQEGAFFQLVEDTGASSAAHLGQLAAASAP